MVRTEAYALIELLWHAGITLFNPCLWPGCVSDFTRMYGTPNLGVLEVGCQVVAVAAIFVVLVDEGKVECERMKNLTEVCISLQSIRKLMSY